MIELIICIIVLRRYWIVELSFILWHQKIVLLNNTNFQKCVIRRKKIYWIDKRIVKKSDYRNDCMKRVDIDAMIIDKLIIWILKKMIKNLGFPNLRERGNPLREKFLPKKTGVDFLVSFTICVIKMCYWFVFLKNFIFFAETLKNFLNKTLINFLQIFRKKLSRDNTFLNLCYIKHKN